MERTHDWPQPTWLAAMPDSGQDREREKVKFYLTLACTYFSAKGNAATLADEIGMTPNAFAIVKSRGQVSPETAIAIETALGRRLFPRELFRPDLFLIEG